MVFTYINFNQLCCVQDVSVKYWPDKGEKMEVGPLIIKTTSEAQHTHITRRILKVKMATADEVRSFSFCYWVIVATKCSFTSTKFEASLCMLHMR